MKLFNHFALLSKKTVIIFVIRLSMIDCAKKKKLFRKVMNDFNVNQPLCEFLFIDSFGDDNEQITSTASILLTLFERCVPL